MPGPQIQPICGSVIRLTALDRCGVPIDGPASQLVSECFAVVNFSPAYDEGEAKQRKNAAGKFCLNKPACPTLESVGIGLELTGVDSAVRELLVAGRTITTGPDITGGTFSEDVACDKFVALEVWSELEQTCDATGQPQYVHWLLPLVGYWQLQDFSIEDAATFFSFNGTSSGPTFDVDAGPPVTQIAGLPDPFYTETWGFVDGEHLLYNCTTTAPPADTGGLVAYP